MEIKYFLEEKDFLTFQLYTASKSKRIIKKRWRNKVLIPIIYILTGILFLLSHNWIVTLVFICIAALWYVVFPMWEKQYYMKHYKSFIQEHYQGRIGRVISVQWNNEFFKLKSDGSESTIRTDQVEEIVELPSIIFITLKTGESFIFPKERLEQIEVVITQLKNLAAHLNIRYFIDDECEWLH